MDNHFTLKEYGYFIKHNLKTILTVMVVTLLLTVGAYAVSQFTGQNAKPTDTSSTANGVVDEEAMQKLLDENFDELAPTIQNQLLQYMESDSYHFRVYIEDSESKPYNHVRTLKELLTTRSLSNEIEEEMNVTFKPDSKRGVILGFDGSTNLITIQVGVGDPEANQKIAQYYYDLLQSEDFAFNENKSIYFIESQPVMANDEPDEVEPEEVINQAPESSFGVVIVLAMLGLVAGFILGVLVSFIKEFFTKEISYLYDYKIRRNGRVYKFFAEDSKDEWKFTILNPDTTMKLLVSEEGLAEEDMAALQAETDAIIEPIQDLSNHPKMSANTEIIILTKLHQTKKKWYLDQLRKGMILEAPVKVIQVK